MNSERMALITGASSGIGREIAIALGKLGYKIGINYLRNCDGALNTQRTIRDSGGSADVYQADVGNYLEVHDMFEQLPKDIPLKLLVNNAATQESKPLIDMNPEGWDRILRVNLFGAFYCMLEAAKHMKNIGEGRIVNIGSGSSTEPFPHMTAYTTSKHGLVGLTKSAAIELARYGITVNCVAPGAVLIPRTENEDPNYAKVWGDITPTSRVTKTEDVVAAVIFFASDQTRQITGQVLNVDGGLFLTPNWPKEYGYTSDN